MRKCIYTYKRELPLVLMLKLFERPKPAIVCVCAAAVRRCFPFQYLDPLYAIRYSQ